ncbi:MAG: ribulose-phosphate 3-epimerase [Chloroflexota bacterium]|nr:MAG: ribulose-phosphate 3-epimerase [Chloroflexota bacterium]
MTNIVRIAPSILSADFTRLGEQVQEAEAAGCDLIHIDVMDGQFVPNITMGPLVVRAVRRVTTLPLDVHLMIVQPERHLQAFADAGADQISIHWEASPNLHRSLQIMRELKCGVGVAINPHTPAGFLSEVLPLLDVVVVMTVNPGFGGQAFLPETLPKIRQLRAMAEAGGQPLDIEVDGGIQAETARAAIEAGANVLIAGSAIYSDRHSVQEGIRALRQAVGK